MECHLALAASRAPAARRRRFLADPERFARSLSSTELQEARRLEVEVRAAGQDLVCFGMSDYPQALRILPDAPPVLYLVGDRGLLEHPRAAGVIGSRRGTERGRWQSRRLGRELARAEVCVVSGLALGVDAESHEGALAAEGPCIGVVATGVDRSYPAEHRRLHERLRAQGLLISEYPPGTAPQKYAFVARNRILAALAPALVVVEAGEGSGALSTVDFALQMGHEVLCYPGPVDCVASRGSNRLLREGALLVRHAADVLESMGWEAEAAARTAPLGLGDRPETAEEIARRRGHPVSQVLTELVLAEEAGTVERCPGGRWRVTP